LSLKLQAPDFFLLHDVTSKVTDSSWLSIACELRGQLGRGLPHHLGAGKGMALEFLCQCGLVYYSTRRSKYIVNVNKWEELIAEHYLGNIIENPVKTTVDNKKFYFINIGQRNLLEHKPMDQFSREWVNAPWLHLSVLQRHSNALCPKQVWLM